MFSEAVLRAAVLSLIPGCFWLVYLRSLSRSRVKPWIWLIAVVAGGLSTQVTLAFSEALQVNRLQALPVLPMLLFMVVGVGLVEEAAKALCMIVGVTAPGWARDPMVALQVSGGVALGFATTENVLYMSRFGDTVLIFRGLFPTLGHVLFSSIWGFALGARTSVEEGTRIDRVQWRMFFKALLLGSVAHGFFNWFLLTGRAPMAVILLCVLWFGFRQAVLEAFLREGYVRETPFELEECGRCGVLTRVDGNYCSFCGKARVGEAD